MLCSLSDRKGLQSFVVNGILAMNFLHSFYYVGITKIHVGLLNIFYMKGGEFRQMPYLHQENWACIVFTCFVNVVCQYTNLG